MIVHPVNLKLAEIVRAAPDGQPVMTSQQLQATLKTGGKQYAAAKAVQKKGG